MPAQRARSAVEADHRSAHPDIPGVPWWGAVLIAVAGTALGFAADAFGGGNQLTPLFAGCYAAGCVVAVLAVRYSSIFTAVVQPPLILFGAVPLAYLVLSNSPLSGGKSTALAIGYPLIERFPLMISTALGVLIIGVVRWYWGMVTNRPAKKTDKAETKAARKSKAKLTDDAEEDAAPRTRVKALVDAEARSGRIRSEAASSRTRHSRQGTRPARDTETRRTPAYEEPAARRTPVRDEPAARRTPQRDEPAARRTSRYEETPWERDRPMPTERRAPRRTRDQYEEYPADYPAEPPRRRSYDDAPRYREPSTSHHPVSNVRYRGEEPRARRAPAPEEREYPRARPRDDFYDHPPRRRRREDPSESWDYDR